MSGSIASWEELILSYLRASVSRDRLCDLAVALSIEWDETEKTDFDDIMDGFSSIKAQKVLFSLACCVNCYVG